MKVQRRFLRKYNNKDYYKYIVNIPPMVLKESGIKYNEEIEIKNEKNKIIIKKKDASLVNQFKKGLEDLKSGKIKKVA